MREQTRSKILCGLLIAILAGLCGSQVAAEDFPDYVVLDSMADLYEGVDFDHEMHADLGEDCAVCHHHTTGTGTQDARCIRCHADSPATSEVACQDCHLSQPFSAEQINREALDLYQYHVDKPGLKAAYHWSCTGCHEAMGGPTGCQDCHARTSEGDAFFHADASSSSEASH